MNQCEMIVQYVQEHGCITTLDAFLDLGITRLASRIHDLKEAGYCIEKENIKVYNRFGEQCSVASYRFKGEEDEQS